MDFGLKDKIAFVAASSDGLGLGTALELAKEGAEVIICGRNLEKLAKAKAFIEAQGSKKCHAFQLDLTKPKEVNRVCKDILKRIGKVDILVTNSGGPPPGNFENFSPSDWENAYKLLFESTINLIYQFLPGMKENEWGRILCITSVAVKEPVDGLILSNAIRSSIVGLVKSLSKELGKWNITVNNVMPGYTKTDRLNQLIKNNPAILNNEAQIPLKRFGEVEEFAAAVTFLASERASYINGINLAIDGGLIKSV